MGMRDEAFASSIVLSQPVSPPRCGPGSGAYHFVLCRPAEAVKSRKRKDGNASRQAERKLLVVDLLLYEYSTQPTDHGPSLNNGDRQRHASLPIHGNCGPQSQTTFRETDPPATPFWALLVSPKADAHGPCRPWIMLLWEKVHSNGEWVRPSSLGR